MPPSSNTNLTSEVIDNFPRGPGDTAEPEIRGTPPNQVGPHRPWPDSVLFCLLQNFVGTVDGLLESHCHCIVLNHSKVANLGKLTLPSRQFDCASSLSCGSHLAADHIMKNLCNSSRREIDSSLCTDHSVDVRPQNPISQNGMAQVGHIVHNQEEEFRNDSGFGSGGFLFTPKPQNDTDSDLIRLEKNSTELQACGFYFNSMDSNTARSILKVKPTGTFLIRDSSDPKYLYSLSVKTERGATSVRILYQDGLFLFDSDISIQDKMPKFESVLALVDFHVMSSREGSNSSWRWEENSHHKNMKVLLKQPVQSSVSSLAHLARVKVNQCLEDVFLPQLSVEKLPLSPGLKDYLKEYPYRV